MYPEPVGVKSMRGRRNPQASMLAFVDLEERVPPHHPLRTIKRFADRALATLSPTFDAMYGTSGRPSIPPERLLKASLLISLYSVRSERASCEEPDYQLLWRWFLDMSLMEPSFDQSTFSKNRGRLLQQQMALQFFDEVVRREPADDHHLLRRRVPRRSHVALSPSRGSAGWSGCSDARSPAGTTRVERRTAHRARSGEAPG
jgi:transposase